VTGVARSEAGLASGLVNTSRQVGARSARRPGHHRTQRTSDVAAPRASTRAPSPPATSAPSWWAPGSVLGAFIALVGLVRVRHPSRRDRARGRRRRSAPDLSDGGLNNRVKDVEAKMRAALPPRMRFMSSWDMRTEVSSRRLQPQ
jgi:hypothetical protein